MKKVIEHRKELIDYLQGKDLFRGFAEQINGETFCDEMQSTMSVAQNR